jgi:site-specific DNA-methyltransferase (adenine-specific)
MEQILFGDCKEVLKSFEDESVNLVVTSPPYADQRKHTYGGIHPDKYVEWFLPISEQLFRVLKKDGSFVLNIKEKVVNGERHTYVIDLIKGMKAQGWLWTEEYIWRKKNCTPGKWPNRFRDAWERCLHFTREKKFKMNQDAVMVPMGDWAKPRLKKLSETDKTRDDSKTKSGFGKNISNWIGREMAYPTNVLVMEDPNWSPENDLVFENVIELATECGNKGHSAAFPVGLPEWFIKLFSNADDMILDPFAGSGTTGLAARNLGREFRLIELLEDNVKIIKERIYGKKPEPAEQLQPTEKTNGEQNHQSGGCEHYYRGTVDEPTEASCPATPDRVETDRQEQQPGKSD